MIEFFQVVVGVGLAAFIAAIINDEKFRNKVLDYFNINKP